MQLGPFSGIQLVERTSQLTWGGVVIRPVPEMLQWRKQATRTRSRCAISPSTAKGRD